MPQDYEGRFRNNEWNAMTIEALCTGPAGYHWALLRVSQQWTARGPNAMMPELQTQLIRKVGGLAQPGRGRVVFVAFDPNGAGWFVRYRTNICLWSRLEDFAEPFGTLVTELERTHPRKDECLDFVAFGLFGILLVRFENGNSIMRLPQDARLRSQISKELIEEVESRLQAGWTFGNRTTLCTIDKDRWFIEWRRGTFSEFRFHMGHAEGSKEAQQRVLDVLSGVGNNPAAVMNGDTAALVSFCPLGRVIELG